MSERAFREYARLFKPGEVARRARILSGIFLDHQFERTSPLPELPAPLSERIYDTEVVMPPFRYLDRPGTQTVEGLFFLVSLAKMLNARSLFEIGTFTGLTTWCLGRNLPGASIDTLDLPVEQQPSLELEATDWGNRRRPVQDHLYEVLPHEASVTQHWADSATFDFDPWKGSVDLVYIDGAHSEGYVRKDTESALLMVSDRGAIVWDDYWRQVRGVPTVLHEMQQVPLMRVPGTRLVVHLTAVARQSLGPT